MEAGQPRTDHREVDATFSSMLFDLESRVKRTVRKWTAVGPCWVSAADDSR